MSDLRKAATLALGALEFNCITSEDGEDLTPAKIKKAITALRQALANEALDKMAKNAREIGLYDSPEQPTQEEQGDSICQEDDGCPTELAVLQRFWRGQPIPYEHYPTWCKPAPVPEAHEPVAWAKFRAKGNIVDLLSEPDAEYVPLYTRPQEREPERQEPVAWMIWLEGNAGMFSVKREAQIELARRNKEYPDDGRRLLPLYTRPCNCKEPK